MDITDILTRISHKKNEAIMNDQWEVVEQLQQLILLAIAVYNNMEHPLTNDLEGKKNAFYDAMEKLPKEYRPFALPANK